MKILFEEILRVYKKAPAQITFIWFLDVLESTIIIIDPYIIGNCIDGLLKRNFCWLVLLIVINIIFGTSSTFNKYFDTRIYSRIVEEESYEYYAKMIKTKADNSFISARLELADDVPNFLEIDFFQILNMTGGIIVSLIFIYFNIGLLFFLFAVVVSALVPITTYPFQKRIVENNKVYKDLEEEQINQIARRDKRKYGQYIKKVLGIEISNSDLDTKIFFVTDLLQTLLIIIAIVSITYARGVTSGQMVAAVGYVGMLNEHVGCINANLILLRDLKDTILRLREGNNNGL